MSLLFLACLILSRGNPQDATDEISDRVARMVDETSADWTKEERESLKQELIIAFAAHKSASAEQREKGLSYLPTMLETWEPDVKPIFSQRFQQHNDQYPVPPGLREREAAAAIKVLVTAVNSGLSRTPTSMSERSAIQEQFNQMFDEVERAVRSRISGDGAEAAFTEAMSGSRKIAEWTLGNPFKLGLDRPLTKEEMERVFGHIQTESAKLERLVIPIKPKEASLYERDEEWHRQIREWSGRFERVRDAVGSPGHALVLCHPEVFAAIDELTAIRTEYKTWRKQQAELSQAGSKEKTDAILKEFEPKHARTDSSNKKDSISEKKVEAEVSSPQTNQTLPTPVKPEDDSWRWLLGVAIMLVLATIVLFIVVRKASPAS